MADVLFQLNLMGCKSVKNFLFSKAFLKPGKGFFLNPKSP